MNLHTLKNTRGAKKRRMRVGRGESSGKGRTAGKGNKGQMSRTGHKHKPLFEGGQMKLIMRIPKRGFTNKFAKEYATINLSALVAFEEGTVVDALALKNAGIVKKPLDGIKVLGDGELTKKLTVKAVKFTGSAKEKIEAVGGTAEVI